jgi:integrase
MAHIRKRSNGHWQVRVRKQNFPDQTKTFRLRADAERWGREIETAMQQSVFISSAESESTSVHSAFTRYLKEVSSKKKGGAKETGRIAALQALPFAQRSLASIRASDISEYIDQREAEGMSPATIVRELALISHLFTKCRTAWKMTNLANPVALVEKPKINDARTRLPSSDELAAIIAESESVELPNIINFAIETAMRRGELLGLQRKFVDVDRRVAHLPSTKNGSARDVPLSTKAIQIIKSQPARFDGKVFSLTPDAVTRAFERSRARAREAYEKAIAEQHTGSTTALKKRLTCDLFLIDLRFHDLRHEAVTRLAPIFPMLDLMKITGHKDPKMVLRYYKPDASTLALKLA